ncbi:hypothetical protein N783_14140 [Pontibacillus marinus BH030004 = DSM 16465]|uniref:Uncharacterized protein n=1 Tax=Pontibacillus marinus BH030004 = DSM 16465 TaxID=1385511 RepID=A0A0A5G3H4_9BACI|nr:hypothetical protein N783_14140 [Pontibacillus marinus BH030004 = DSM 16465]
MLANQGALAFGVGPLGNEGRALVFGMGPLANEGRALVFVVRPLGNEGGRSYLDETRSQIRLGAHICTEPDQKSR